MKFPSFKNAGFKDVKGQMVPVYILQIPVSKNQTLTDLSFKLLATESKSIQDYPQYADLGLDYELSFSLAGADGKHWASIQLIPIKSTESGLELISNFSLNYKIVPLNALRKSATTTSLLATGDWYKMGITSEGIYQLNKGDLEAAGINMNGKNPENLRMFSYGGGRIPSLNSAVLVDDLEEIAIEVRGQQDGSFDVQDMALFYASSQHKTIYKDGVMQHVNNPFEDTTFYYLTFDHGKGKRIQAGSAVTDPATATATTFQDFQFHETENTSVQQCGQKLYGEYFDITQSYNFSFNFPNAVTGSQATIKAVAIARNDRASNMRFISNGTSLMTLNFSAVNLSNFNADYADEAINSQTFSVSNPVLVFNATYNDQGNPSAIAWLDYIELTVDRQLLVDANPMFFQDINNIGANSILEFQLSGMSAEHEIWAINDHNNVELVNFSLNGSTATFKADVSDFQRFVCLKDQGFSKPHFINKLENQNLHGLGAHDMVIITHPNFKEQAEELAQFHLEDRGLKTAIVTPRKIYNEFSSGALDPMGIRLFIKHMYDTHQGSANNLKYVLLMGDASYDFKNKIEPRQNFVPSFPREYSLSLNSSYITDDYYTYLDDNEGNDFASSGMDVAIGRFPVTTSAQASDMVNKVKVYRSPASYGDWRNNVMLVADDVDADWEWELVTGSEVVAKRLDLVHPSFNINKIYLDAFEQVSTAAGDRYPDATEAMLKRMEKGVLMLDYIGHGGELGWAHESILNMSDVNGFTNINALNVLVTITCEFTRFDDAKRTSAGERIVLNPNGGSIGIFSTTRQVGSTSAINLGKVFFEYALLTENGEGLPMGEMMRRVKNDPRVLINLVKLRFNFFGDPSLPLAVPVHKANVAKINGVSISSTSDTINALSLVEIEGEITNNNGQRLTDFEGTVIPVVFDKPSVLETFDNDGLANPNAVYPIEFELQQNIIYKGKVAADSGKFSFKFVVPKDIAYQVDFGKISLYAFNDSVDATGYYDSILIGGANPLASADEVGPTVKLYMNDESFVFGGLTDDSPSLFARIEDENGVNTVGNGIGHDLTATLDNQTSQPIVLNDFYEADLNSYQSGTVKYPLSDLSPGKHTLKLKVWDVYNNSSSAFTEFVVAESADLALDHVLNYPNPFTTYTEFHFEHNRPNEPLDVQVQILTVSGKLVKTINQQISSSGYRVNGITWNGLDDFGDQIGKGVYIYRLKVKSTSDQSVAEQYEKLVILR